MRTRPTPSLPPRAPAPRDRILRHPRQSPSLFGICASLVFSGNEYPLNIPGVTDLLERLGGSNLSLSLSYLAIVSLTLVGWFAFSQRSLARRLDRRRRSAERRARAEYELRKRVRESEEHFRFLVESVEDYASFMLDRDGRIASWNAGAERLFGYHQFEVIGSHVSVFYTAEARHNDHSAAILERTGREGRYKEEGWRLRKDGSRIWAAVMLQAVYDGADLIGFVKVVHDLTERKEAEDRTRYLAEAGKILGASLDVAETLRSMAYLLVPALADWCVIHLLEEGELRTARIAHSDPSKIQAARELEQHYPLTPDSEYGVYKVLRTGRTELIEELNDVILEGDGPGSEQRRFARELGVRSTLIVPLRARGRALGTLSLLQAESGRRFDPADVNFVEDLAVRIALAVDNARLYHDTQEASERITRTLESITDAFFTVDRDWRFTYLNRRAEQFMRRSRDELLGRSILEAVPEVINASMIQFYRRALRERVTMEFEHYYAPTGKWFEVRAYPSEEGVSVYFHDITERRRAEDSLRILAEAGTTLATSLDYHETLTRLARMAVPVLADWSMIDVLEAGQLKRIEVAVSDRSKAEFARRYRDFPPDPNSIHSPVSRVLRTGKPELISEVTTEVMERAARNSEHIRMAQVLGVRSIIVVPLVARGQTLGALTLVMSESGRRFGQDDLAFAHELATRAALAVDNVRLFEQAHEAHQEAERRAREEEALRLATAAVSAAFTIDEVVARIAQSALAATNSDGALLEWFDSEHGEVEVVAVAGKRILPSGARMPVAGSLAQTVIDRGEAICIDRLSEINDRLSSGLLQSCADCAAMAVPLAEGATAIGALILLREPERARFRPDEVERARTFADLAALAFRKVRLLEESERRRNELIEVMESRSRLMRGFSHDVKNPLGAADGFLQLLEDGVLGELQEQQQAGVQRARRALGTAFRLIQELLDLARAEAGEITVERHPVDLRDIVRETLEEYRARAEAKGLATEAELPADLPVVECDPIRVRQILGNLLSNAIKYTPAGEVRVRVCCQGSGPAPGPDRWAAIDIIDSGPGIPESEQRHLFQEFRRLGTGADSEGVGIGLAISRRIAHALGGEITVTSAEGRGATFTLWLPVSGPGNDDTAVAPSVD